MMTSPWWLGALALAAAAAVMDWRHRSVSNRTWKRAMAFVLAGVLVEAFIDPVAAGVRVVNAGISVPVIYGLWRIRAFRGADAKGLMVFSVLLSPYEYLDLDAARIYPLFDALIPAFLAGQIYWMRTRDDGAPFFVMFAISLAIVAAVGNPVLRILQVLVGVVT